MGAVRGRGRLHARGGHRLRALRAPPGPGRRAGGHRPGRRGAGARAVDRAGGAGRGRARRGRALSRSRTAASTSSAPRSWWGPTAAGRRWRGRWARTARSSRAPTVAACYFAYWRDGGGGSRSLASQWRQGRELVTAFPCDDGLVLVLLMPPVERAEEFAADLAGEYDRTVASVPQLAERLRGATTREQGAPHHHDRLLLPPLVRAWVGAAGRRGPLQGPGDRAGHPRRAALRPPAGRAGRTGAGRPAPARPGAAPSGSAAATANACRCTRGPTGSARGEEMGALEIELYRRGARDPELARRFLDVMARTRAPADAFGPATKASLALAAARAPGGGRAVAREIGQELRDVISERVGQGRLRFARRSRRRPGRPRRTPWPPRPGGTAPAPRAGARPARPAR